METVSTMVGTMRVGDLVRVRRRLWRVRDIKPYDRCQVVTLLRVGALKDERRVVAPFDTIERLDRPAHVRLVPRSRWRPACRALLARHVPPGSLRTAADAKIDLLPHQLEPALALVSGMGSRFLIADEVGLGKTIQAGLMVAELKERAAADRVLVLTPAGLRDQWIDELRRRFGIAASLVDARHLRRRRAELSVATNPWATFETAVTSIDFVKRPDVLASVRACHWDVVIVDEAHNVAGDSDRHDAVAALARRAGYVVLLTATPHNGERELFRSLCSLGGDDSLLVFRRTRSEVGVGAGRRVQLLRVRPTAAERRMHAMVGDFGRAVIDAANRRDVPDAVWLALAVLTKRALSSARALQFTIERRLATLEPAAAAPYQQGLPFADPDGERQTADEAPDMSALSLAEPARERWWFERLLQVARSAARRESKISALGRFLRRIREPAIVFTEYRDTLLHLEAAVGRHAAILHGGLSGEERAAAIADFAARRCTLLLATDAAGEGLNFQNTCRLVINLELPWNPMRLEQRIGRVDRIGQSRRVHAVHLVARDTAESMILQRLRKRIARAQTEIGAANPLATAQDREIARAIFEPDRPHAFEQTVIENQSAIEIGTIRLAAAGRDEASRVLGVRRLKGRLNAGEDALWTDSAIWLTFARSRRTRAALGCRLLLLYTAACEDTTGRIVESTLVPAAFSLRRGCWTRQRLDQLLVASAAMDVDGLEEALAPWRRLAFEITNRFNAARRERERVRIDDVGGVAAPIQSGLFDRRAERERAACEALAADELAESRQRIARLDASAQLTMARPRLCLALAPRR